MLFQHVHTTPFNFFSTVSTTRAAIISSSFLLYNLHVYFGPRPLLNNKQDDISAQKKVIKN